MWSNRLIEWHFWLGLAGIMLYVTAMWGAGVMQGLMWRAYTELGFLKYSFLDSVVAAKPLVIPGYRVANLPAASANLDGAVRVIDRNNRFAISNGTTWRWVGDGTAVS